MSKKVNPVLVGSFVLGGAALSIAGLILFGGGKLFERRFMCVAYFEESLSGLDIGAPVEYKGVRIGTVSDVRLIVDDQEGVLHRPVTVSLEPNRVFLTTGERNQTFSEEGFSAIVERGMRAKLATQSMLTGKLKLELDFYPDRPPPELATRGDLPVLPTVLSPFAAAKEKFGSLPFEEIVMEARNLMSDLSKIAGSDDMRALVPELNKSLKDVQSLVQTIQSEVVPVAKNMGEVTDAAKATMGELTAMSQSVSEQLAPLLKSLTVTTDHLGATLDERSSIRLDIEEVLNSLSGASRAIADLADFIQRHPESLLRGKGGAK